MTDQKLNLNINLGKFDTWKFMRLIITNNFMNQKLKTMDPIDWMKFISTQSLSQSLLVKMGQNTVIFWSGKITVCLR